MQRPIVCRLVVDQYRAEFGLLVAVVLLLAPPAFLFLLVLWPLAQRHFFVPDRCLRLYFVAQRFFLRYQPLTFFPVASQLKHLVVLYLYLSLYFLGLVVLCH